MSLFAMHPSFLPLALLEVISCDQHFHRSAPISVVDSGLVCSISLVQAKPNGIRRGERSERSWVMFGLYFVCFVWGVVV